MSEPIYLDLLITDDDLVTNNAYAVEQAHDRAVIAQDIRHAVRESGLALPLVGMRQQLKVKKILTEIELLVESDKRLKPGTVFTYLLNDGRIAITADTKDYGKIGIGYER